MNIRDAKLDFAYDPGLRKSTDYIILHHAAGDASAEDVHRYHRYTEGWAGIAYHFYVDKLGGITKGREIDWNGGHTADYNRVSLGVCFEGNFEKEEMGERQLEAGRELLRYLREKYPAAQIMKHRDMNATACPGKNFPMEAMLKTEAPSAWAQADVEKWIELGLLQGDGAGNYGLQEPVTLERMIVLIERRLKEK